MVPNPYPAHAQLRFREISRAAGLWRALRKPPGTRLHRAAKPNFAWDTAQTAKRRVEETLLNVPPAACTARVGLCANGNREQPP